MGSHPLSDINYSSKISIRRHTRGNMYIFICFYFFYAGAIKFHNEFNSWHIEIIEDFCQQPYFIIYPKTTIKYLLLKVHFWGLVYICFPQLLTNQNFYEKIIPVSFWQKKKLVFRKQKLFSVFWPSVITNLVEGDQNWIDINSCATFF